MIQLPPKIKRSQPSAATPTGYTRGIEGVHQSDLPPKCWTVYCHTPINHPASALPAIHRFPEMQAIGNHFAVHPAVVVNWALYENCLIATRRLFVQTQIYTTGLM
jgi:hypothetical protein